MSQNDGYRSGSEFLDARHAQRQQLDHQAREQAGRLTEGTRTLPDLREAVFMEAGRANSPKPFGTGGMIDRIGISLSRLEAMFQQLEAAIEPTLERAGETMPPTTGNAQAVQVPNTEHGEALYEIESRIDSLTRRMNAVGARVRL